MPEQFDTSWFDLKKYEDLRNLDLISWLSQIKKRSYLNWILHHEDSSFNYPEDGSVEDKIIETLQQWDYAGALTVIEAIKENPKIPIDSVERDFDLEVRQEIFEYPFNTYSVHSTPAANIWLMFSSKRYEDVWNSCRKVNRSSGSPEDLAISNSPMDNHIAKAGMIDRESAVNVTIDLTVTDAQIKKEFAYWLTHYRKYAGYKSPKKSLNSKHDFTKSEIDTWVDYKLLAYIDLILIAEFEESLLREAKITRLIYPDEQCDFLNVDKRMELTKTKSKWLLLESTEKAIEAELRNS